MPDFDRSPEGLAFSPAVLAAQERLGGRDRYRDAEWPIDISPRGGPPGFLQVLDSRTLAMADLPGNQQYITIGNLSENDRVELFLIDYMHRKRVKIWGRGRMVEDDPALVERLLMPGNPPWTARALVITVEAWDVNCPQHIPQRFEAADVAAAIEERERKIAALEAELAALRGQG